MYPNEGVVAVLTKHCVGLNTYRSNVFRPKDVEPFFYLEAVPSEKEAASQAGGHDGAVKLGRRAGVLLVNCNKNFYVRNLRVLLVS
jgi:hypothetical protein